LCKIKLLKSGIRVVYRLIRTGEIMKIIVIAARADDEVYKIAADRIERRGNH
jgi:mRNA interferase RelE/StbE